MAQPKDEKPAEQPKAAQPKDEKPAEQPKAAQPKDEKPAEQPKAAQPKDEKPAEQPKAAPQKFGMPPAEFDKLSLRQQKQRELADKTSPLRRQATKQDRIDFQLLSNTPAHTIAAMTGVSLKELEARAKQLETTLKGTAAGDGNRH